MSRITYIERKPESGAIIIYGNLGKQVYLGYTIREAKNRYIKRCKEREAEDKRREHVIKESLKMKNMSIHERVTYLSNRRNDITK